MSLKPQSLIGMPTAVEQPADLGGGSLSKRSGTASWANDQADSPTVLFDGSGFGNLRRAQHA